MELTLSPRLKFIADSIKPCKSVLDIGSDHAYLPIYLVKNKICESAVASDVNSSPLSRASSSIKKLLGEQASLVRTVISDGLDDIDEEFDYIVIAGLGGDEIKTILSRASLRVGQKLILQPMTKSQTLRRFLYDNFYIIEDETAVAERSHRIYSVMNVTLGASLINYNRIDTYISKSLRDKNDNASRLYKNKVLFNQKKRVNGLFSTLNRMPGELEQAQEIYKEILHTIRPEENNENL